MNLISDNKLYCLESIIVDKNGESSRHNNDRKEEETQSASNLYHTNKQKEILNDLNTNPKYSKFFEKYGDREL